jgi:hypothetical protein
MHDERPGDSKDICRVVRTEFLVFSEDSNTFSPEEMAECSLKQRRGLRRQPDNLILTGLAADPDLDLVALAELVEGLGRLAVLVREFDELQYMGSHGEVLSKPNIRFDTLNCNI